MSECLTFIPATNHKVAYVIFDKVRGKRHFWNIIARGDFAHCYCILPCSDTSCIFVHPLAGSFDIDLWQVSAEEAINLLHGRYFKILKVTVKVNANRYYPRGIITCVSIIKYHLGLKFFCITPRGLYKKLKKKGAIEMGEGYGKR